MIFEAQLEASVCQLGTPRAHQERHVWHIPGGWRMAERQHPLSCGQLCQTGGFASLGPLCHL